MKYVLIVLFLSACGTYEGPKGEVGNSGKDGKSITGPIGDNGKSCTVIPSGPDTLITCEDGSSSIIHSGLDGSPGIPGTNGNDGYNSVTSLIEVLPSQGLVQGGTLFSVGLDLNRNGLLDVPEVQHAALIRNGRDGTDGQIVVSPFSLVDIIDPCGDTPGYFDEVLLRLGNGMLLATISNNMAGDYTRLGIIPAGNWVTTDQTNCHFTVTSQGLVTW